MKLVAIHYSTIGVALVGQLQTFIMVAFGLVIAPISPGIINYTAQNQKNGVESAALWWKASIIISSLVALLLALLILSTQTFITLWIFNNTEYTWILILCILSMPVVIFGTLAACILIGSGEVEKHTFYNFLGLLISTTSIIISILLFDMRTTFFMIAMQNIIITAFMCLGSRRSKWFTISLFIGTTTRQHLKDILSYSYMAIILASALPLAILAIRNLIIVNIGLETAGIWQASWKISEVYIGIISTAFSIFLLPLLAKCTTPIQEKALILQNLRRCILFLPCIAIILYFLSNVIIYSLYTSEFTESANLYEIQLLGDIFKVVSWLFIYVMIAKKRILGVIVSEITFAVLFFFLSWLLIPVFEATGVSIAYTIISMLYALTLSIHYFFPYISKKQK